MIKVMSESSVGIAPLPNTGDILNLKVDGLYTLLKAAYAEMIEIEQSLQNAENKNEKVEEFNQIIANARKRYPTKKDPLDIVAACHHPNIAKQLEYKSYIVADLPIFIGILLLITSTYTMLVNPANSTFLSIIAMLSIGAIIFGIIKSPQIKKGNGQIFNQALQGRIATYNQACADTQKMIDSAQSIYMIPRDYRDSFIISRMLTILDKKWATNWTTLVDRIETDLHNWRMEQNSNEALEYQRFIALKAGEAAGAARTAAGASLVSAGINIARLFI